MHRVFVDGVEGGMVAADDPGLLLGMTVFETMRTYDGIPFRMDRHLERMSRSAEFMDIDIGDTAQIGGAILHTHDLCSPLEDVRIRVTVTAGGRQIIDLKSLNTAKIRGPISVGRLSWDPPSFLPGVIKHGSRAAWVVASTRQGVEEVLLVDSQGNILEASRSNVFVVKDGVVLTPASDERSLEGVTRGALIEAGRRSGLVVEEADVPIDGDYDEFYLSSTLKELAPVVEICGVARESGGPVGDRLLEAFLELVKEETGYESA